MMETAQQILISSEEPYEKIDWCHCGIKPKADELDTCEGCK